MAPAAWLGLLVMLLKLFGGAVWLLLHKGLGAVKPWLSSAWLNTRCLLTGTEGCRNTPCKLDMSEKCMLHVLDRLMIITWRVSRTGQAKASALT
jgi:hypothetical protein